MEDAGRLLSSTVIEILERSSLKTLVRLKCVSKCWRAFLKSNTFINSHFQRQQKKDEVLLVRRHLPPPVDDDVFSFLDINSQDLEEVLPNLSIPFLKEHGMQKYDRQYAYSSVHILGPSVGVVCITYGDECIILCNPALRQFKKLPPCPSSCPKDYRAHSLAHGFGNTLTNEFKVVSIHILSPDDYVGDPNIFSVHVYSSRTNSWSHFRNENSTMPYVLHFPCAEVFFNGACHWTADSSGHLRFMDIALAFDVTNEVFRQIELPDCLKKLDSYQPNLLVIKDCLSLLRCRYERKRQIDIWVMKEYGIKESWSKEFVIGPHVIICPYNFSWKNDECVLVETTDGQLESYALHDSSSEKLPVCGTERSFRCQRYKASLISLNQLEDANA